MDNITLYFSTSSTNITLCILVPSGQHYTVYFSLLGTSTHVMLYLVLKYNINVVLVTKIHITVMLSSGTKIHT